MGGGRGRSRRSTSGVDSPVFTVLPEALDALFPEAENCIFLSYGTQFTHLLESVFIFPPEGSFAVPGTIASVSRKAP